MRDLSGDYGKQTEERGYVFNKEKLPKALKYVRGYMLEGKTKQDARIDAGYSPKSGSIDANPVIKYATLLVEEQRKKMAEEEPGFSFHDVARRLKDRAMNPKVSPTVQTDNDKVLVSMFGYNAPQKVEVNKTSLIAELGILSKDDLEVLSQISPAEFRVLDEHDGNTEESFI